MMPTCAKLTSATKRGKPERTELWLRDIKTTLGMERLRTKTPSRVQAEMAMFLFSYNLIRAVMHNAAHLTHASLSRLSLPSMNPHRPGRVETRGIQRRPKPFPRMQQPRRVLQAALLRAESCEVSKAS